MHQPTQYVGKICERHPELGGLRRASNHGCVGCCRERSKLWNAKNKESIQVASRAYQERNRELLAERARKRREDPLVRKAEKLTVKQYAIKNVEIIKAQRKARGMTEEQKKTAIARAAKWNAANKTRRKEIIKESQRRNPGSVNAGTAKRRAVKCQATPSWANEFFINEAYRLAKLREMTVGGKWQVDHIVPLRSKFVCGLHCEANLQVIMAAENIRKSNRHWPEMP